LSGSTLYGTTTEGGGKDNIGTIFQINTDGGGYQLLHRFTSGWGKVLSFRWPNEGEGPHGSLALSGVRLYGTAPEGGWHGTTGTIFKIGTDGGGFGLVHTFGSIQQDGSGPNWLTLLGSTLYGTTSGGGNCPLNNLGDGTVFRVDTDGGRYRILHSFGTVPDDGKTPQELVLSGSTLYGTTALGGDRRFGPNPAGPQGTGTIFRIETDGTGYRILHRFTKGPRDGASPYGPLTLSGSTLYGTTSQGGAYGRGSIFRINTDGSGFQLLHSFNATSGEVGGPIVMSGTTLYGISGVFNGGSGAVSSIIFSFKLAP